MLKVIGLCGPAGSGKSEVAKILLLSLPVKWQGAVVSFAKPVKDIAFAMGWDGKKDERGRRMLQLLGTEVGRGYDPDLWVRKWLATVSSLEAVCPQGEHLLIVADDVRFENEVQAIHRLSGQVWEVCRPGHEYHFKHVSEQGVWGVDGKILNEGSLEQLEEAIRRCNKLLFTSASTQTCTPPPS